MQGLRALAVLGVLTFAVESSAQNEAGTRAFAGTFFDVQLDFDHVQVGREAVEAADAVWQRAVELIGAAPEPARRRTVYLHWTKAAYYDACDEFVGGRLKQNGAFSAHSTGHAHVLVEPAMSTAVLDRIGVPYATRRLIQHECAHLAVYETFASFEHHPGWLAEGLATWVESEVARAESVAAGVGVQPRTLESVKNARVVLRTDRMPSLDAILDDQWRGLSFYERYGVQATWFRFLVEHRRAGVDRFLERLRGVDSLGARGPRACARLRKMLREALADGWADVHGDYVDWLEREPLPWTQVYRSLQFRRDCWVQSSFPKSAAAAFRLDERLVPPYAVSGTVEVLAGSDDAVRQANVLVGRHSDARYVQVALRGGEKASVTAFLRRGGDWQRLGAVGVPALVDGKAAFRVEVMADGSLRVAIDGVAVLAVEVPGGVEALSGAWGVGAQRGATVVWGAVEVTKG